MFCLDTNCASLHQHNSLCFKGDSLKPCNPSWGQLVHAQNTCKKGLLQQYSSGIPHTSHLYQKPPLLSPCRASAVPSEPHSGPPAPKPCAGSYMGRLPVFMKVLLQILLFKQKQNSYVQISLPVNKHSPVLALQWVKAAPHKSRQKLIPTFNGKVTVRFNTLFLLIHQYNCSSRRDTNILFL